MNDDRERQARLEFCRDVLLPIWEQWTDGNPALRRLLECSSADPASHEERLRLLIDTTGELRRRGGTSRGVEAARLAAAAALKASVGVPAGTWWEPMITALAAAREAARGQEGRPEADEGVG